jgi:hypothetical protein
MITLQPYTTLKAEEPPVMLFSISISLVIKQRKYSTYLFTIVEEYKPNFATSESIVITYDKKLTGYVMKS